MSRVLLAAGVYALWLAGCSPSTPTTYPVSGAVSFDGKPVDNGDIVFVPMDHALGPDAGKICAGKYSGWAKAGKCRVEIRAVAIGPDTPRDDTGAPIVTNYVPARYNNQSELTAEVSAGAKNVFDFSLQSVKVRPNNESQ